MTSTFSSAPESRFTVRSWPVWSTYWVPSQPVLDVGCLRKKKQNKTVIQKTWASKMAQWENLFTIPDNLSSIFRTQQVTRTDSYKSSSGFQTCMYIHIHKYNKNFEPTKKHYWAFSTQNLNIHSSTMPQTIKQNNLIWMSLWNRKFIQGHLKYASAYFFPLETNHLYQS